MNSNERITQTVNKVLSADLQLQYEGKPGMCLAIVRQVIEKALDKPHFWLYKDIVTSWVAPDTYDKRNGHWARDFEFDCKRLGWAIPYGERKPGDMVFNWRAAYSETHKAYIGHVGILWYNDLIFENINRLFRPISFTRHSLALTPYGDWPVTLVARIPKEILKEAT
ncbi:MAG: hypothetical protein LC687_05625 [Actinobacteria bacterium]|nr:hypothetical protein [Actinomycetota bacterium]MCA1807311.1 hypothetical protein [Actinomycetota bacterium]